MYIYPLSVSTSICSTNKRKMLWVPSHREHNGHNEHIIRYLPLLGLFTGIIFAIISSEFVRLSLGRQSSLLCRGPILLVVIAWQESAGVTSDLRLRALVRQSEMQPLGEEAPVDRHLAAVAVRNGMELVLPSPRQLARRVHRDAGEVSPEGQETSRGGRRRLDPSLELAPDMLALAQAAD